MSSEEEVQKKKANRKNRSEGYPKMWWMVIIVVLISIIMIIIYFWKSNDGLSYDSNSWSAFGSYFGSVTGLLAFAGVLYSSHLSEKRAEEAEAKLEQQEKESRKRYIEDSERAIFFQLLDLHNNKLESVNYNPLSKTETKIYFYSNVDHIFPKDNKSGFEAFKSYVKLANNYLCMYLIAKDIEKYNTKQQLIEYYSDQQTQNFDHIYKATFNSQDYATLNQKLSDSILNNNIYENDWFNDDCYKWALLKCKKLNKKEMYEALKYSYDLIYRDYGHILGHYFRNMYYILDTITNFRGGVDKDEYKKKYARIFRAQLSRFEIALIICNAVSSQSTKKVIELLQYYDILNGFYNGDLIFTKSIPNSSVSEGTKDYGKIIIDEILEEAKKQFSNVK